MLNSLEYIKWILVALIAIGLCVIILLADISDAIKEQTRYLKKDD